MQLLCIRPSVLPSHQTAACSCCQFAAVGQAAIRYWSIAAQHTAANVGSATLSATIGGWMQDLLWIALVSIIFLCGVSFREIVSSLLPSVLWRCWLGGRKGIWYRLTRVFPDKGPLNVFVCVCVRVRACLRVCVCFFLVVRLCVCHYWLFLLVIRLLRKLWICA